MPSIADVKQEGGYMILRSGNSSYVVELNLVSKRNRRI